ncbi:MAG: hemerythrin domain-containing protein [Candidatus Aureabacteria bacterium]|nr:hemerythrin domain-containing protein [Candidatus Auribacterota bacterium]
MTLSRVRKLPAGGFIGVMVVPLVLCAYMNPGEASGLPFSYPHPEKDREKEELVPVSAVEDLMREHGVLSRILLIYEEACARLDSGKELPPDIIPRAANLVRRMVENYHEKLEEQYIFPHFEKAGEYVDLVKDLREQHHAGRRLTDRILRAKDRNDLTGSVRLFIRMYRPHKAREDTILFPAVHYIVSPGDYAALGKIFDAREDEALGEKGFERAMSEVEEMEKELGIHDLAKFTRPVK